MSDQKKETVNFLQDYCKKQLDKVINEHSKIKPSVINSGGFSQNNFPNFDIII